MSLNLNCLNHYFPLFSALPNSCTIKFSLLILNHIKMCIMRGSLHSIFFHSVLCLFIDRKEPLHIFLGLRERKDRKSTKLDSKIAIIIFIIFPLYAACSYCVFFSFFRFHFVTYFYFLVVDVVYLLQ